MTRTMTGATRMALLCALAFAFALLPGAASAQTQNYQASTGFSTTQGQGQWYYQYWDGTRYIDMTWNSTNNWWGGPETYLLVAGTMQHPGEYHDSVRKWVAPRAGSVRVTGQVYKNDVRGGDGVNAMILHNAATVFNQAIAFNDATGDAVNVTRTVSAGDAVYFVVNRKGDSTYDGTKWDPLVEYTDDWTTSGTSIYYNTGNVGIGTTSPASIFEVFKDQPYAGSVATMTQVRVNNSNASGFSAFSVWGTGAERGRLQYNAASPNIFVTSQGTIPLHLGTNDTVRLTVDGTTGNVGIGTNSPATRLHVAGDIRVDGNLSAKYQDVAEWVPSTQKLAAGTVVILDPERSNQVLASTSAYDTSVAGVVSEQPGLLLGEGGEGKVKVATTGRVKVRVDATRRAVRVGDLLVTSDVAGVAMRSEPVPVGGIAMHRPGTIVGKALEPLAGGTGEILVLLSLQ